MRALSELRIALCAGSLGQGGAERQLFYILQALRRSGNTPRLFSFTEGEFWENRIRELGVRVIGFGASKGKLARLIRLIRELKKEPADVVQSQHFYTSAYVGAAARFIGIRGIGAMRSNGVMDAADSGSAASWMNLRAPNVVAANSHAAIRYAEQQGISPKRLFFLPNVVDTDRLKPSPRPADGSIVVVGVGSLLRGKRFDRYLSILKALRQDPKRSVRGVIAGGGALRSELEQKATELGLLPSGVQFLGSVADMPPIYQAADLCLLTSDYEGTPNVLLEAMSCGLPVVATKVGGIPDLVRDGETGFLAAPEDLEGLTRAVARLVDDPELRSRMGQNARQFVLQNHSVDRLPHFLQELYALALT